MFKLSQAGLFSVIITPCFCVYSGAERPGVQPTSDNVVLHGIHDRKLGQYGRLRRALKSCMLGGGGPVKWN